ncbi:apolipoprotein N-acyltransferase [Flavimobilis soli]|uniref:Apolipoprotein N-acyltransferase n=1 Tax=Flavimobilis soli TaxID=442709 RepID=A0A2A9EBK5_9MICO|nr:apolipoprotein N-acyltransferase [Flavimobilis soli]PFG35589.1 apolipoprotein N-acyltransferase [Flavimobilis soli]
MPPRPTPLLLAIPLAIIGGLGLDVAFPDRGVWPLAYAAVGLLYIALRGHRARAAFVLGSLWGIGFFVPHLSWAGFAAGDLPWFALATAEGLLVGVSCAALAWTTRIPAVAHREALRVIAFALALTAGEVLRSSWPFGGFPWGRLAFSQADSPLGRFAWLGGTVLVSFLVALVGALVAVALLSLVRLHLGRAGGAVVVAFVLVAGGLFVPLTSQPENGRLALGAVQGNVAEPGLRAFATRYQVLGFHADGTRALLDTVEPGELDLVVWPENASDVDPRKDQTAWDVIDQAARDVDAPVLVGSQQYVDGGRYNQSLLWQPGEGIVALYAKQRPAPFGEYIPMRSFFSRFSDMTDLVTTDMLPGEEIGTIALESPRLGRTVVLGDVICFEVAYDDIVRSAVAGGAEILLVQTNNSNFGYSAESTQQLAMSRIRAIESGRATIQISTVGVSGVIDATGRVQQRTGLFEPAQLVASVPLRTTLTPATRLGTLPAQVAAAVASATTVAGMIVAVSARRSRRKS